MVYDWREPECSAIRFICNNNRLKPFSKKKEKLLFKQLLLFRVLR